MTNIHKKSRIKELLFAVVFGVTVNFIASQASALGVEQTTQSQPSTSMITLGEAKAPIGYIEFCKKSPWECVSSRTGADIVLWNKNSAKEIDEVNRAVNAAIQPITDLDHFGIIELWSYPTDGKGDCEDYVLLKRKILIERGYPRDALLITVVRDHKGEGHAVLTVVTSAGDFILDNHTSDTLPWRATGYTFIKREAKQSATQWASISADNQNQYVASSGK